MLVAFLSVILFWVFCHHTGSCFRRGSAYFDFLFADSDVFVHFSGGKGGRCVISLFRSPASDRCPLLWNQNM